MGVRFQADAVCSDIFGSIHATLQIHMADDCHVGVDG